jgi:hypothetical protein
MIRSTFDIETGFRFGRLTVVEDFIEKRKRRCICICDCGESKVVRAEVLRRGDTKSCGCIQRESGPWNKGLTGVGTGRPGPRPWFVPAHKLPVGSETIRRDKVKGSPRVYRKVAEPNVWRLRAVIVWEELNGPVPKGRVIHHRDRNSLNDDPKNLQCLTRSEHASEHARDLAQDESRIE